MFSIYLVPTEGNSQIPKITFSDGCVIDSNSDDKYFQVFRKGITIFMIPHDNIYFIQFEETNDISLDI